MYGRRTAARAPSPPLIRRPPALTLTLNLSSASASAPLVAWLTVRDGWLREDLELDKFARLFAPHNAELVAQKRRRWISYLAKATPPDDGGPGALLARPTGFKPAWRARVETLQPFFGRLNSSNDDVEHELQGMRERALAADPDLKFLKMGGDGLLFIRISHLLAENPDEYIHKAPAIIPGLGEQPHGLFHLTDAVWRVLAHTRTHTPLLRDALLSPIPLLFLLLYPAHRCASSLTPCCHGFTDFQ